MGIELIGEKKIIMENPGERYNYFAWPSVERLRDGRIAVGASGFRRRHICPYGKAVIMFSEDEGESYSAPVPVIDTCLDDRDCGLAAFGENGLVVSVDGYQPSGGSSEVYEKAGFNTESIVKLIKKKLK